MSNISYNATCTAAERWDSEKRPGLWGVRLTFDVEGMDEPLLLMVAAPYHGDAGRYTSEIKVGYLAGFLHAAGYFEPSGGYRSMDNRYIGGWTGFIHDAGGWVAAAEKIIGTPMQLVAHTFQQGSMREPRIDYRALPLEPEA